VSEVDVICLYAADGAIDGSLDRNKSELIDCIEI
jgi:hypothetical protein